MSKLFIHILISDLTDALIIRFNAENSVVHRNQSTRQEKNELDNEHDKEFTDQTYFSLLK